ncbi:hypothetical protein G7046_g9097 [Stylonectria norvegica]|nr:hypothetical protein G7046_g9097 [Stylonectria norvegica]
MPPPILPSLALGTIAIFGYLSILGLTARNGWAALFAAMLARNDATLPGTDAVARTAFTRVPALDYGLVQLVRFFYPCVSGERPALTLFAAWMAGQVLSMHTALGLEGLRKGNRGAVVSFTVIWGTLYQSIPVGIILPIYFIFYLWTSPLARPSTSRADLLSMDPVQLRALTGAMTLGYIVPTVLLCLPSPGWVSFDRKQALLAVWQFFPLWVCGAQYGLVGIVRALGLVPEGVRQTPGARLHYGRRVYRYILGITAVSHLATMSLILFPRFWSTLSTASDPESLSFQDVFMPMSVLSPHQVQSIAEGSQTLLQYDMYCACSAAILWVSYLSYASSGASWTSGMQTAAKSIARTLVVGPGGAVLWALWDGDREALREVAAKKAVSRRGRYDKR